MRTGSHFAENALVKPPGTAARTRRPCRTAADGSIRRGWHDSLDDREPHARAAGVAAGGVFACAKAAAARGELYAAVLRDSKARLNRTLPVD
jgi:hypothetical protein